MAVDPIKNYLKYEQAVTEGWERLTWAYEESDEWGNRVTKTAKSFDRETLTEWCEARCKDPWVIAGGTILIKNPKEAMLFKLAFYNKDTQ